MLLNILFAGAVTFSIFLMVEFLKSIQQFLIFKKVRETILLSSFSYLKQTPHSIVDLNKMREMLLGKLSETKLSKWVNDLKITWQSSDAIQFVFELKFNEIKPKYKFVIGLKDIEEIINKANG